jgi:V8-like Glu-specific endopeptidase
MSLRWLSVGLFGCMLLAPAGAEAAATPIVELGGGLGAAASTARQAVHPVMAAASSVPVAEFSSEGLRTNGRVFGFDPREGPYSCSGTALSTPSRSIVLTAGHCVLEDGSTGRNLVFVPSYDHGRRPFGTFIVEVAYLMPQWRKSENPDFDVAALQVGPNELGRLTDVVGGRGFVSGRSRDADFQIFGYPAAALRGEELRSCRAHGLGSDELTNRFSGPPTLPATCDMAGGSSGGAWIVDGQYVDGVTSYGYTGSPNKLYSPYFGSRVGTFLAQLP